MQRSKSLVTVLGLLAFGVGGFACSEDPETPSNGGRGGSSSSGGAGGGTRSGGSTGSGGSSSGTGGSSSGTGGSVSTGGSVGAGGSSAGGTGGSSAGGAGGAGGRGGSMGSGGRGGAGGAAGGSGGAKGDAGPTEGGSSAKLTITVDHDMATSTPDRLCFKKEASSSGGDKSPKIDWTAPPAGTKSLVVMVEDMTGTPTPHQVVCNLKPTETGRPADAGATIPEGAEKGTGHGKPMDRWYGPGAGAVHKYEITVFALATEKLQGGCTGQAGARAARNYLRDNKTNKAVILDFDTKALYGNASGACR